MQRMEDGRVGAERSSGAQAIAGAVIAIVGVLAAANPGSVLFRALSEAAPAGNGNPDGDQCVRRDHRGLVTTAEDWIAVGLWCRCWRKKAIGADARRSLFLSRSAVAR